MRNMSIGDDDHETHEETIDKASVENLKLLDQLDSFLISVELFVNILC